MWRRGLSWLLLLPMLEAWVSLVASDIHRKCCVLRCATNTREVVFSYILFT